MLRSIRFSLILALIGLLATSCMPPEEVRAGLVGHWLGEVEGEKWCLVLDEGDTGGLTTLVEQGDSLKRMQVWGTWSVSDGGRFKLILDQRKESLHDAVGGLEGEGYIAPVYTLDDREGMSKSGQRYIVASLSENELVYVQHMMGNKYSYELTVKRVDSCNI